ncbi:MAG: glycosyltransferase [Nitrospinae bacterium]|nr:glycosyltransferase [Nitrospinota bacterium]
MSRMEPLDPSAGVVIFTDLHRGSYKIIGSLYLLSFQSIGVPAIQVKTPETDEERQQAEKEFSGKVIIHLTIGPCFTPVPGAVNVAAPYHEWSRYPAQWAARLNQFHEVWAPSHHVKTVLERSGVTTPVVFMPPALDLETVPAKTAWGTAGPVKFLSCGEPHFRKGFHLLMEGFQLAFPRAGEARLVIKTSPSCQWKSPREDIHIETGWMERGNLLAMYKDFDFYVSASLGEGLGLPLAEAALAGLPLIANFWGGHTGLLCEDGFIKMEHVVADQFFCSEPSFYAPGQQCGYSSPSMVASALKKAAASTVKQKKSMTEKAMQALKTRFGREEALGRLKVRFGI